MREIDTNFRSMVFLKVSCKFGISVVFVTHYHGMRSHSKYVQSPAYEGSSLVAQDESDSHADHVADALELAEKTLNTKRRQGHANEDVEYSNAKMAEID